MAWPKPIDTCIVAEMTTDDSFGNYHKQYLLLIKDKQSLYQQFLLLFIVLRLSKLHNVSMRDKYRYRKQNIAIFVPE